MGSVVGSKETVMIGEKEACLHERVLAIPIRQLRFSTRRQQQLHDAQLASAGGEMQRGAILHHFAPVDVNLRRSEERAHYDLVALVTGHVEGRHAEGVNLVRVRAGLEQLAQRDSIAVLRSAMQGGNGLLRRAALRVWCWEESTRASGRHGTTYKWMAGPSSPAKRRSNTIRQPTGSAVARCETYHRMGSRQGIHGCGGGRRRSLAGSHNKTHPKQPHRAQRARCPADKYVV